MDRTDMNDNALIYITYCKNCELMFISKTCVYVCPECHAVIKKEAHNE